MINKFVKKYGATYLFLSPWIILYAIFGIYPLVYSIILSFTKTNMLNPQMHFLGLNNYIDILSNPVFWNALKNTVIYAVGTIPFTLAISIIIAVLINEKIPFKSLFRAGFFLPSVTAVIVIALIFKFLYEPEGIINMLLMKAGIMPPEPSWLLNTKYALPAIMIMAVWSSFGYYMLLFLAGLQNIPEELYEAASVDGCSSIEKFFYIILPQLKPIILLAVVINTIRAFQVFPEIFTMTRGGPLGSTTTVVYLLYQKGFQEFRMGYASAIGYVLFFVIMILSLLQMKFLSEKEN